MNNRKPKYLIFYISSAGSGILLFSLVTAYGSANLKAPVNIEGHYKIDDRAWPGCLNGNSLWLNIQQSGIYLNGLLANNSNIKETKSSSQAILPLTGEWEDRKFSLAGPVAITACPPNTKVEIGGSVNKLVLSDQLNLNSNSQESVSFTANHVADESVSSQQSNLDSQ